MTCIVGVVEKDGVYIGGDSAGVDGWNQIDVMRSPKVFQSGPMLFGYCGSFRMGQLLQYAFTPPQRHPDTAVDKYMATEFLNAWRNCLRDHGLLKKENDVESGGTFLVAYEGRLFTVQSDHSVLETGGGYSAVGSGYQVALGALQATPKLKGETRVVTALQAAEAHIASVRRPFTVGVLK